MGRLPPKKTVSMTIRATVEQKKLLETAAKVLGCSVAEFMLEASCLKAKEVLPDQAFFTVDRDTFERIQALLDKPLSANDGLIKLLNTKASLDK